MISSEFSHNHCPKRLNCHVGEVSGSTPGRCWQAVKGGAASSNIPHPETRSPKGEASKDTLQRCFLPSFRVHAGVPASPFEASAYGLRTSG